MWLDKRSCRNSDLVVTVGRDLCETLEQRFQGERVPNYTMINNWIDEKQIKPLPLNDVNVAAFRNRFGLDGKYVIMYSGNIGLYYDLEGLLRVIKTVRGAKTSDGRDVAFAFVGDGSVLGKLKDYQQAHQLENVIFIPYQEKDRLVYSLNAADVHWCVNAKGIKGVSCPSKFYGIAAVGKPVLAVLEKETEVRMLIEEIGCGKCTEPGEYEEIRETIRWFADHADDPEVLEMGKKAYEYLRTNLTKDISVRKYIEAINRI